MKYDFHNCYETGPWQKKVFFFVKCFYWAKGSYIYHFNVSVLEKRFDVIALYLPVFQYFLNALQ